MGETLNDIAPQEAQRLHAEIQALERELASLRAHLIKDNMFNRRVELNVQIKQIENRKKEILKELN